MELEYNQTIDVIIATYNSKGLLAEQLDSILNQSYKNLRVLIRDDGSTDDTLDRIKCFQNKDKRVFLIEDKIKPNGVGENFKILLTHCSSEYVFISDQDDVWNNDKVEVLLKFALENFTSATPSIAYAPGLVVNENLENGKLLTNYRNKVVSIKDMLLTNGGIQGCAMIINRPLYKKANECQFYWYMHDQVLTALAVTFGETFFYPRPLFLYRQHSSNVLGFSSLSTIAKFKKYLHSSINTYCVNIQSKNFFNSFNEVYSQDFDENTRRILFGFLSLMSKNKVYILFFILRYKIKHQHSILKSLVKCVLAKKFFE